jgi:large subunit ribosomal protein L3
MLGRKIGMTRIFEESGRVVPVTVLEVGPCVVVQNKTVERDGYAAVQLGFMDQKLSRLNAPLTGHFQTRSLSPKRHLREFALVDGETLEPGDEVRVDMFTAGQKIAVQGTSKGKGFAGGMKRHNFQGGPGAHGASKVHRRTMSAGATDAARIFPGQRMPGQLGAAKVKTKGLTIVAVDNDRNLLLVKGPVPGANGGLVAIYGQSAVVKG